jgi:light-harvesting complex I chlorophyll a/b binding protein 1
MVSNAMLMNVQSVLTARSVAPKPFVTGRHAQRVAHVARAGDPAAPDEVSGDILDYAKTLPGISQPFPNIFDPADFLGNARTKDDVKRWRESEITHGRVAMLASLGFIAQEQLIDWPQSPFPHVEGAAITHFQQVEAKGAIFWEPLVFAIGLAEAYRITIGWANPKSTGFNKLEADYTPGDLGFDPLNLYPSDPKQQYDLKTKELNNGRLAMIAIAAFVAQELRVQKPIFENAATAVGAA